MQTVLVTGGTGRLGGALLAELQRGSARLRVLSRRGAQSGPGGVEWVTGDLRTGAGLPRAVADASVIIHCATDVLVPRRDLSGTRALVEAARRIGQPHLVYISIVGIEEVPLPYYRIKLEVERYVQACGLPWTILRTTQFHNLVFELIQAADRLPIMLLPASTSCQPVDVRDVASRLAALVGNGPAGRVPDLGGPQVLPAVDFAYDYLQVFERRRIVLPVRIPGKIGRGYRNGGHLTPEHADGRRSFHNFLLEESRKPTRTPLDASTDHRRLGTILIGKTASTTGDRDGTEPMPYVMHKPRPILATAVSLASPAGRAAGVVALGWHRSARLRRLVNVAADASQQRRHPTRERMRSLVAAPGGRLHWRDTATPRPPGPLGATVAPLAMATCDMDRPICLGATMFPLPLHLGHECVAEVLAVGEAVQTVHLGDRVVVPFQISCGVCRACRQGLTGNCRAVPPLSMYGFGVAGGAWGGVFAEQVAVPFADAMLVPLSRGIDPAAAASAADTLSDAYRHIVPHQQRIRSHPDGPSMIIVGAVRSDSLFSGSLPLYAGMIAKALGDDISISLVDSRPWIRAHAGQLGLNTMTPRELRRCSAPLVVDCSAEPRGLTLALRATAPDGLCSSAGTLHATARIPTTLMFARNVTLSVSRSHARGVLPEVLTLIGDGRISPGEVTTTLAPFEDAPAVLRDHLTGTDTKTVLVR